MWIKCCREAALIFIFAPLHLASISFFRSDKYKKRHILGKFAKKGAKQKKFPSLLIISPFQQSFPLNCFPPRPTLGLGQRNSLAALNFASSEKNGGRGGGLKQFLPRVEFGVEGRERERERECARCYYVLYLLPPNLITKLVSRPICSVCKIIEIRISAKYNCWPNRQIMMMDCGHGKEILACSLAPSLIRGGGY